MPLLTLLRHCHAARPDGTRDHDRPLDRRGRDTADAIGRWFVATGQVPDLVVTSSARRTVETVERAVAAGGWPGEVRAADDLYLCDVGTVLDHATAALVDGHQHVLLVGHEPTWSAVVTALTGAHLAMPTGTLACVEVHTGPGGGLEQAWLRSVVPGRQVVVAAPG